MRFIYLNEVTRNLNVEVKFKCKLNISDQTVGLIYYTVKANYESMNHQQHEIGLLNSHYFVPFWWTGKALRESFNNSYWLVGLTYNEMFMYIEQTLLAKHFTPSMCNHYFRTNGIILH